ncbi:hypothetical protein [Nocardia arthritidis]|uniref:Uncharacterized protein n=1 Tax=Nocardia arthritidis TaxID=228602 RepID=A0A6G9YP38_9NOCA|nr:hypothetical protein [Nocardia arthritidis]QIS14974.1 hypothetical protein F5544_35720 [Nocardia arthritidis]
MSLDFENLRLSVDVALLQRLPETSPAPEGAAMLGAPEFYCSWDEGTCCCTHPTLHTNG